MAKSKRKKSGPAKKQAPKPKPAAPAAEGAPATKQPPKQRRDERIAALRVAERRRARMIQGAAIVAVVAVIVGVLVYMRSKDAATDRAIDEMTAGSCTFDERSDPTAAPPGNHVTSPSYEVDPPAGGNHLESASPAGVFTAANTPPDGQLVHSLEHGYVIFWHRPDLPAAQLDEVKAAFETYDRDVLVVPRATVQGQVAATAWGKRLLCGEVEREALEKFVLTFRNKGPEKIPH